MAAVQEIQAAGHNASLPAPLREVAPTAGTRLVCCATHSAWGVQLDLCHALRIRNSLPCAVELRLCEPGALALVHAARERLGSMCAG